MPRSSRWRDAGPNMSDAALLVSVEDLINMAMGPDDQNTVNYKLVQMILHILARQMRMLETRVEVRIADNAEVEELTDTKKKKKRRTSSASSSSPSPPRSGRKSMKPGQEEDRLDRRVSIKSQSKLPKGRDKTGSPTKKDDVSSERRALDKTGRDEYKERERTKSQSDEPKKRGKDKDRDEGRSETERSESPKDREKAAKERIKAKTKEQERTDEDVVVETKKTTKYKEKVDSIKAKTKSTREIPEPEDFEEYHNKDTKQENGIEAKEGRMRGKAAGLTKDDKTQREHESDIHISEEYDRAQSEEKNQHIKTTDKSKAESGTPTSTGERVETKDRDQKEGYEDEGDDSLEKVKKGNDPRKYKSETLTSEPKKYKSDISALSPISEKKSPRRGREDKETKYREDERDMKYKEDDKERTHSDREKKRKDEDDTEKRHGKEMYKTDARKRGMEEREEGRGPKGDKVLVVEKGPTTRSDSHTKLGSIEVVTRSQFEQLESEVRDLKKMAGPLPMPAMPDNKQLRKELARGIATLGDTMQAMQVASRVEAAEKAIGRMAGLLTQLAAAGALPDDVANQVEHVTAEMEAAAAEIHGVKQQMGGTGAGSGAGMGLATGVTAGASSSAGAGGGAAKLANWPLPLTPVDRRKSVAIDPTLAQTPATRDPRAAAPRPSVTSRASAVSRMSSKAGSSWGASYVTHNELEDALASLKDELAKNLANMTTRATNAAETAAAIAKAVADKLDIALKLDSRISTLYSMVQDYSEQLSGFDVGLTTQMQSFQEQMSMMRNDLKMGLKQLQSANNNTETAAVMELSERYESLVVELDHMLHAHIGLTAFQNQLGEELKRLAECVETLREQKADREEVQDGLRDKADNSRLAGLLTESKFAATRAELERRLDCCYDKFSRQESVWMGAIKDLTGIAEQKAELMQLMSARDEAQQQLREIKERLGKLAIMLGEPKAALLTRQLSRGGACGSCLLPALQEPVEPAAGRPPALPAARPRPAPVGEEEPCAPTCVLPQPYDEREHTCLRWAGGSHTLVTGAVRRVPAEPLDLAAPTHRYAGCGTDGRMYLMEDELAPCIPCLECNPKSVDIMTEKLGDNVPGKYTRKFDNLPGEGQVLKVEDGAGDTGGGNTTVKNFDDI